jgi:hypothetical protein
MIEMRSQGDQESERRQPVEAGVLYGDSGESEAIDETHNPYEVIGLAGRISWHKEASHGRMIENT